MKILRGLFIVGVLMLLSGQSFALRCGGHLIDVGDPLYLVRNFCTVAYEYRVQNENVDMTTLYIKQAGMTYALVFIDGKLRDIDGNRLDIR